ncbi:MAG: ribokinase [Candidatus Edwardsbacteria bacterium]
MSAKIVVVGSSNTDMVIKVPRLPMPGETLLGSDFFIAAGGKGANQAVAIARLGGDVSFVARIGKDSFGEESISNLINEGIDVRFIVRENEAHSGVALIFVDSNGENQIVVAPGSNSKLSPYDVYQAEEVIKNCYVLLVQLEIPLSAVYSAIELAKKYDKLIILNPAPAKEIEPAFLSQIHVLTPNEHEVSILSGIDVKDEHTAKESAYALIDKGVENVVVTMGGSGTLIVNKVGSELIHPPKVKPVDTTAAGDAFNGALAFALARNDNLSDAVRFANFTAALSVTRMGAQPSLPTFNEVVEFMESGKKCS